MEAKPKLNIGRSTDFSKAFTLITLMMTTLPVYAATPVGRMKELAATLQCGDYLLATDTAGHLKAVVLWRGVRADAVERLVAERRLPTLAELDPDGKDKLMTAMFGNDQHALLRLGREFRRLHRGNYIFFERHFGKGTERRSEFGWQEPSGKIHHAERARDRETAAELPV